MTVPRAVCICVVVAMAASLLPSCRTGAPSDDVPMADAPVRPALRLPDVSGMARVDAGTYLVVHDAKSSSEPRAGVIAVDEAAGASFEPLQIDDAAIPGGHLADIEALAAISGRSREFLAIESGAPAEGRGPRRLLVHLRLESLADGQWALRVLGWVDVWSATSALENCEALACWSWGGELRVLLADRTRVHPRRDAVDVATVEGVVVLDDGQEGASRLAAGRMRFQPRAEPSRPPLRVPVKAAGAWRLCADLHVDARGTLWGACAQDLGGAGPFRSRIYRAGSIEPGEGWPRLGTATFEHDVDGLKVEAIADCDLPRAALCFATDDEIYGGVWRPLRSE